MGSHCSSMMLILGKVLPFVRPTLDTINSFVCSFVHLSRQFLYASTKVHSTRLRWKYARSKRLMVCGALKDLVIGKDAIMCIKYQSIIQAPSKWKLAMQMILMHGGMVFFKFCTLKAYPYARVMCDLSFIKQAFSRW